MSIINILSSMAQVTQNQSFFLPFYKNLFDAIEHNNLKMIDEELNSKLYTDRFKPEIVAHFLQHFSSQKMDLLFYPNLDHASCVFQANVVVEPVFWNWLISQEDFSSNEFIKISQRVLQDNDNVVAQQSAVNFFTTLRETEIDWDKKNSILCAVLPMLNTISPSLWHDCVWCFLQSLSTEEWGHAFDDFNPNSFLTDQNKMSLKYFYQSLDKIPHLRQAFDDHYADLDRKRTECIEYFSSPKGIRHSCGFKNLSKTEQKNLLSEIAEVYEDDDYILAARYKHILGYTSDELFLNRFGGQQFDFVNSVLKPWSTERQAVHPLHILLQQPESFLNMGSDVTPFILQHLDFPLVLENMFDNMNPIIFSIILHIHPQLARWKDCKGNSLGHWCAVTIPLTPEWLDVFQLHPSLLEPNNTGYTLRDIVLNDIDSGAVEQDVLAVLDRIVLSKALSDTDSPPKMGRRRKI